MLTVDVIDSQCSLRRRHLAVRVDRYLIEHCPPSIKWTVRDFPGVAEWRKSFSVADIERPLVFLHASENEPDWTTVPSILDTAGTPADTKSPQLVTYSGGSPPIECFAVPDQRTGTDYLPTRTLWWRHYGDVESRRDRRSSPTLAARVGLEMDRPPIERILRDVLGGTAPTGPVSLLGNAAPEVTTGGGTSATRGDDGLRHRLANAVGPLFEALDFAIATGSKLPSVEKLWSHLSSRMSEHPHLPSWVPTMLTECEKDILPRLISEPAERTALAELRSRLRQLEAFVVALDRSGLSWSAVQESLPLPKETCRVLWVDDEEAWHDALRPAFAKFGITTTYHSSVTSLPSAEALGGFDAIVLDLVLEGQGESVKRLLAAHGILPIDEISDEAAGLGLLQLVQALPLPPPTFVLSARESPSVVRACTVLGARDYFVKGRGDYVHLLVELRRAVEDAREHRTIALRPANPRIVVGRDDPLVRILLWIDRIASSGSRGPVLFVGQPGVGKEEFARELHLRSARRSRPFVVIDCSTIVPTLIESELFGHRRGAFNGAVTDKPGLFELADGGVAFIDEIDKFDVSLQNRLLRVAAKGETRRVGDTRERHVDIMLVLASNIDPKSEQGRKTFSEPLITRVDKYLFRLPSLQERAAVVPTLASALCARVSSELGFPPRRLDPAAAQWLERQAIAGRFDADGGNVRGLYNLIERTLVFSPGESCIGVREIELASDRDLPLTARRGGDALREAARLSVDAIQAAGHAVMKDVKDEFEAQFLRELIARLGRQSAATLLGTNDANLRQFIKKLRDKGLWKWDL